MYKVKITAGSGIQNLEILRQMPGRKNVSRCGKYQFFINEDVEEPDFWIVRNKYQKRPETHNISPLNTILMVSEPRSVVSFPKKYRDQFGMLCTCQEGVKHRNVIYCPPVLPWWVGASSKNGVDKITLDYDDLKKNPVPQKTKLLSVITSDKAFTQGHQDRIEFVEKLKEHYGDELDVFGRGFNEFEDKWDVLAPYKYHIALENSSFKYYWTEKLADCYLASTFPIYYGCTNIADYFPDNAYKTIDIHNFQEAVVTIDQIIAKNEFEKNQDALKKAKELVLDDYNVLNFITDCLDTLDPSLPKQSFTIKPAITIFDWHNVYLYFIERNIFALKKLFRRKSKLREL